MTGLHDSLRYGVVIFVNAALYFCPNEHATTTNDRPVDPLRYGVVIAMNAALYFCPNEHVFKKLSSLVGYNWRIFKYVFQQRLILY